MTRLISGMGVTIGFGSLADFYKILPGNLLICFLMPRRTLAAWWWWQVVHLYFIRRSCSFSS